MSTALLSHKRGSKLLSKTVVLFWIVLCTPNTFKIDEDVIHNKASMDRVIREQDQTDTINKATDVHAQKICRLSLNRPPPKYGTKKPNSLLEGLSRISEPVIAFNMSSSGTDGNHLMILSSVGTFCNILLPDGGAANICYGNHKCRPSQHWKEEEKKNWWIQGNALTEPINMLKVSGLWYWDKNQISVCGHAHLTNHN